MTKKIACLLGLFMALAIAPRLSAQDTANAIDQYFQQYLDDDRFSLVYISPRVFQFFDNLNLDDDTSDDNDDLSEELVRELAVDLRGLRILSTDQDADQFYQEAIRKLDTTPYEALMTVRKGRESKVEFMIREDQNGNITEMLLIAGDEDSFTLMSFVGNINLNTVSRLADEIEKGND